MPKTRQEKERIVQDLSEKVKAAKSSVFANLSGVTVAESETLRKKCKESKVELFSVKKTLLRKALRDSMPEMDNLALDGSVGVAICLDDEVAAAKAINDFSKTVEKVSLQGGILEGKVISMVEAKKLANLPSKLELLSQLVRAMQSPVSGFVNVLAGNLRGLVTVLTAIKNNK